MSSALKHVKIKEPEPKTTSGQILHHEILEGLPVLERPFRGLLIAGVSAGFDLEPSLFFMAIAGRRRRDKSLRLWFTSLSR